MNSKRELTCHRRTAVGTTPTVMTIDGTLTTVFTSTSDSISPSLSPVITTIDGVAYTFTLASSAQTTTLPNGSILILPPTSSVSLLIRPSINGGNGGSGTRTANTAFASARPTSAGSAMRARGGWVVAGVTLVLGFTL